MGSLQEKQIWKGRSKVQFWTQLLIKYPSAEVKLEFWEEVWTGDLKVIIFKTKRLSEITKGVSTGREDQGLSPGGKQQRGLRSRGQIDHVQGPLGFAKQKS